jgi:hypothetical protein
LIPVVSEVYKTCISNFPRFIELLFQAFHKFMNDLNSQRQNKHLVSLGTIYTLSQVGVIVSRRVMSLVLGFKRRLSINKPWWCSDKVEAFWSRGRGFESRLELNFCHSALCRFAWSALATSQAVAQCNYKRRGKNYSHYKRNCSATRCDGNINPAALHCFAQ